MAATAECCGTVTYRCALTILSAGSEQAKVRGRQMLAVLITVLLVATAFVSLATIHASVRTAIAAVRSIGRELTEFDAPRPVAYRARPVRAAVRRQSPRPVATAQRVAA